MRWEGEPVDDTGGQDDGGEVDTGTDEGTGESGTDGDQQEPVAPPVDEPQESTE